MPELPDLTVFVANLTSRLKDKEIESIVYYGVNRLNVSPEKLKESINNTSIQKVTRVGKEIEFVFSNDNRLLVHLMLNGGFSIVNNSQNIRYKILELNFSDDSSLVITDPKGLVMLNLNAAPSKVPDALDISEAYLKEKIKEKPRKLVKPFLLDQKITRGIGNAYADEILWHARISPLSKIGKLPDTVVKDLLNSIKDVLLNAVEEIKKINPDIISGEIREFLSVHNYSSTKSPTGHKIIKEQIASKTTFYTDEQVLYE
jgi:formamidopyrimidine-DNA glycosylase